MTSSLQPVRTRDPVLRGGYEIVVENEVLLLTATVTLANGVYDQGGSIVNLSAPGLASTWLGQLMSTYDKFRIVHIVARWVPVASALASGAIAMWYDPDTQAVAPTAYDHASGNARAVTTQVHHGFSLEVTAQQLARLPWYQTRADAGDRSNNQGSLQVAWSAGAFPTASTGPTNLGFLWARVRTHLAGPSRANA